MPNELPSLEQVVSDLEAGKAQTVDAIESKSNGNGHASLDAIAAELAKKDGVEVTEEVTEETTEETVETETKPVEKPVQTDAEKKAAARFAALARKEKEGRDRQRALEERERQIEERLKAADERDQAIKAARKPSEVLKAHGLSYQDASMEVFGQYQEKPVDPVDQRVAEKLSPVEKQLKEMAEVNAKLQKQLENLEGERIGRAMKEVHESIKSTAEQHGHEYINAVGDEAVALVKDVISDYLQKNKKLLTYKEACDTVEAYYERQATRLTSTEKVKSRFATQVAPKPTLVTKDAKGKTTLTQGLSTTSVAKSNANPIDDLPKHEALAALIPMLKYEK